MEENRMQVRRNHSRRRPRRRTRRFPWGDTLVLLLAVVTCVLLFHSLLQGAPRAAEPGPSAAATPAPTDPVIQVSAPPSVPAENLPEEKDDAGWNLVLVNNENAIPENCQPNLVEAPGGEQVDERIYEPLMELLEAAKAGNWDQMPMVVSGYRTQKTQQKLFDDKVTKYQSEGHSRSEAEEMAKQWVAVPGYSEHQLGLAVDINGATYDLYFWLQENSWKYGFIFRYPGNKTELTGVAEEVWHYRYVGVEAATEMYEKGLCLEEYLAERQGEE